MRVSALSIALVAAAAWNTGCDESDRHEPTPATATIQGAFERLDAADPTSPWIGEETVRVFDDGGVLLCDSVWEIEASETPGACASCELALDIAEEADRDDCAGVLHTGEAGGAVRLAFERTLQFDPRHRGTLLVYSSEQADWVDYAQSTFDGELLDYIREVPDGFRPRADGSASPELTLDPEAGI